METKNNFKEENLYHTRRCNIKLTLNTLALGIITAYIYYYQKDISLKYNIVETRQFWRIITCLFYSQNQNFLIINLVSIFFLSLLREIKKGSFAYILDLFAKHLLICSFSILFYLFLSWSAKFQDVNFLTILNTQKDLELGGFIYVLTSEVLVTLHFLKKTPEIKEERFFFKNSFLLCLILVAVFYFNFGFLTFWISIFVAILEIVNCCNFYECLQKSGLNYFLENNVFLCSSFFYYHNSICGEQIFVNDEMKLMRTESTMSERNYSSINSDINKLDFEDGRYEKVNVDDYMLKKNQERINKLKPDDSFEI
jgi:hypothetical protein